MSATKFSNGPWTITENRGFGPPYEIGDYSNVHTVAGVHLKANANLIAAAPDLYDLARNVGGFDDDLLLSADLNMIRATLREYREQARAALAKAEGRNP